MYLSRTIAAALIAALAAPPALGQIATPAPVPAPAPANAANARLKADVIAGVEQQAKLVQEMVDSVYSFAEPGFQEFQTMEYLTGILEKNGFTITRGVAGMQPGLRR